MSRRTADHDRAESLQGARSRPRFARKVRRKLRSIFPKKRRFSYLSRYLYSLTWLVLRVRKPFIIGVTGSAGKTTTTLFLGEVLQHESARAVVGTAKYTLGSLNDSGGLPATVLGFDRWFSGGFGTRLVEYLRLPFKALKLATVGRYPDVLVLEYGAGGTSDIGRLAKLARPDIAIVTTVGAAHLQWLKSLDGVVREKGKLVQAVPPSGLVILGQDHDYVEQLERLANAPVVELSGRGLELSAEIARTVVRHLGVSDAVVEEALEVFEPPERRQTLWQLDHLTILDDSFNANPVSMKFGLETLSSLAASENRRLAILGGMAELGEDAPRFHREVGSEARLHADFLVGVGEHAEFYKPDLLYSTSRDCAAGIEQILNEEDCILVKGSNVIRMEPIVQKLKAVGREGITRH